MLRENPLMRPEPEPDAGKQWPVLGRLVVLAGFWLFIGFALGTVLLLYPVRWWATFSRAKGWAPGVESVGVVAIIVLLVVASFALAYWAMKWFVRTDRVLVRALLVLAALGVGGAAYWKWVNPATMKANMGTEESAGTHFTVGPYPDAVRLAELRKQGYTGVISLLHPAVVPFEPQLIAREKREAAAAGIQLIHLPMLPWVSDNTESLERLRALAASKQGRYYIHCYLGVDRVNVARRIIEQAAGESAVIQGGGEATQRTLDDKMAKGGFERGPIFQLQPGLYLTPYPTDGEFVSYILGGEVKHVIALLDPSDAEEQARIDYERKLFASHALPFQLVEVGPGRYDALRILRAVDAARKLPPATVMHSFFSADPRRAAVAEAVIIAHRSGLPPLPPSMWTDPMRGGQPEVIAPHIAIGPPPTASEFSDYLRAKGVRSAMFVGDANTAPPDKSAANLAGIEMRVVAADPAQVMALVKADGPHYLYGSGVELVKPAIVERYSSMMQPAAASPPPAAAAR